MHRRISINTLSLDPAPLPVQMEAVRTLGVRAIAPTVEQVMAIGAEATRDLLRQAGLAVSTLTHRAFGFATEADAAQARRRLDATIGLAAAIGAETITFTTGGRGTLPWGEAADRFVDAIAPCADHARKAGVILSLEPTSHLYADVSIAHRLADTVALAERAGIGVGIDLFACWIDSDIECAIAAAAGRIALVQVSDQAAGDRALPCRAVPGDGMIPLQRLLPTILDTGFAGFFDLEIIGPRMDPDRMAGLARAGVLVGALLEPGQGDYRSSRNPHASDRFSPGAG